jgi:hypothetical protein
MKLKKFTLFWIAIVLAVVLLIAIHVNFRRYGFYYATHMPHAKDEYPVVREIDRLMLPAKINAVYPSSVNIDRPDFNFNPGKIFVDHMYQKGDLWYLTKTDVNYSPDGSIVGPCMTYTFSAFRYRISKIHYEHLSPHRGDREKLLAPLEDLTARLKRESPRPKINLQWLYNLRYLSL